MELVFALKKGVASSSLAASVVELEQAEGVIMVNMEGSFPVEPKDKAHARHIYECIELESSTFSVCPGYLNGISLFRGSV